MALLAGGIAVVQIVRAFTIPAARHILGIILILIATAIAATSYTGGNAANGPSGWAGALLM